MSSLRSTLDDSQEWTTDEEDDVDLPELLPVVPNPGGRGPIGVVSAIAGPGRRRGEDGSSYLGVIDPEEDEDDEDDEDEDYVDDDEDADVDDLYIDYDDIIDQDAEEEDEDVESIPLDIDPEDVDSSDTENANPTSGAGASIDPAEDEGEQGDGIPTESRAGRARRAAAEARARTSAAAADPESAREADEDEAEIQGRGALRALLTAVTGATTSTTGSASDTAQTTSNLLTLQALLQSGQISSAMLRRLGFVVSRTRGDGSERRVGDDDDDDEEEDDDDDDEDHDMDGGRESDDANPIGMFGRGSTRASSRFGNIAANGRVRGWEWFPIESEGKEAGRALAHSGEFGRSGYPPMEDRLGKGVTGKRRRRSSSGASAASAATGPGGARRGSCFGGGIQPLSTSPQASMGGLLTGRSPAATGTSDRGPARQSSYGFSGMPGGDASLSSSPSTSTSALSTSPQARRNPLSGSNKSSRRRLTGSSNHSSITQREDKIRGIQEMCKGRGAWAVGQSGWRQDFSRGVWGGSGREEWNRHCLPNSNGTIVASYEASPYIGQHSHDSTFFYTATQDFNLHLYSTQDAPKVRDEGTHAARSGRMAMGRNGRRFMDYDEGSEDSSLREIKKVTGVHGNWTVTDADLSRDNQWMIYSSITPQVHIFRTAEHEDEHQQLDFAERGQRGGFSSYWGQGHFGIWSVRLSADAKEVVAGCGSGQIMVYDIERKRRTLCISAHRDDVNGVCFADDSTNVLVSGSDDGYVKVWDRRSLAAETPAGILAGHTEGITYVSPKGDGRYVCSNGKDQTIRLWDLRKMISHTDITRDPDAASSYGLSRQGWDYRNSSYQKPRYAAHPKDCSVMQYRGHRVTKTLIRCHFSPAETTGSQYIYTGGSNGVIYIYALDGRIVQVLDRSKATRMKRPDGSYNDPSAPVETPAEIPEATMAGSFSTVVRDVSWSVDTPSMISTAWEYTDQSRGGNVAVHEWRGLGKGGLNRLEDWVELDSTKSDAGA